MKSLITFTILSAFLLTSCSKEKQTERMLYGEWEVTSFLHGANDLTQLYKDSCGCRLVFSDIRIRCFLNCPHNSWNYYFMDSLNILPWKNHHFHSTSWDISSDGNKIEWFFGNTQPDSIYRWGMYPLTIRIKNDGSKNSFMIEEISNNKLTLMFSDSINETYVISFHKNKD
jgi:hypothetical protein